MSKEIELVFEDAVSPTPSGFDLGACALGFVVNLITTKDIKFGTSQALSVPLGPDHTGFTLALSGPPTCGWSGFLD